MGAKYYFYSATADYGEGITVHTDGIKAIQDDESVRDLYHRIKEEVAQEQGASFDGIPISVSQVTLTAFNKL